MYRVVSKTTRFFSYIDRNLYWEIIKSILPAGIWDPDVFHELICDIENDNELEMFEEKLLTDKSYRSCMSI